VLSAIGDALGIARPPRRRFGNPSVRIPYRPTADLDLNVVRIAEHQQRCVGRVLDSDVARSKGSNPARQFVDVLPRPDGEAHMVEAGAALVERLARVIWMLD
jgi:hypothetical protein